MKTIGRLIRMMVLAACVVAAGLVIALWATSYRSPLVLGATRHAPQYHRLHFGAESDAGWLMAWRATTLLVESIDAPFRGRGTPVPPRIDQYFDNESPPGRPDAARHRFGVHSSDTTEPTGSGRVYRYLWRAVAVPHAVLLLIAGSFPAIVLARRVRRSGFVVALGAFLVDFIGGLSATLLVVFVVGTLAANRSDVGVAHYRREARPVAQPMFACRNTHVDLGFARGSFVFRRVGYSEVVSEPVDRTSYVMAVPDFSWVTIPATPSKVSGFFVDDLGFRYSVWPDGTGFTYVSTPWWAAMPVLLLAVVPSLLLPLLRERQRAKRIARGLCGRCGYDLRASTGACPECGTPIAGAGGGAILPPPCSPPAPNSQSN